MVVVVVHMGLKGGRGQTCLPCIGTWSRMGGGGEGRAGDSGGWGGGRVLSVE